MRDILIATLKTGGASFATLILGAISAKILAVVLGPEGTGLYSLLLQILQAALAVATLGGGLALVQGLASRTGSDRDAYLVAVGRIFAIGAIGSTALLAAGGPWIAGAALQAEGVHGGVWGDASVRTVVPWLAVPLLLAVGQVFCASVLNSTGAVGRLAIVNLVGSAAAAIACYPLATSARAGDPLALVALTGVASGASFLLALAFLVPGGHVRPLEELLVRQAGDGARQFLGLAGTMLATSLAAAGALLAIRALLAADCGLGAAGVFSAAWTLGTTYVLLVLSPVGTYYLPTLSRTTDPAERRDLIARFFRFTVLAMPPLIVAVIVTRPLLVRLLYSADFLGALETMRWMQLGDYLKATSWVFAMPMVAFAHRRAIIVAEFSLYLVLLGIAAWAISAWHWPEGVGVAFVAAYFLYLGYTVYYGHRTLGFRFDSRLVWTWLCGLSIVSLASGQQWTAREVDWTWACAWVAAALALSWAGCTPWERNRLVGLVARRRS